MLNDIKFLYDLIDNLALASCSHAGIIAKSSMLFIVIALLYLFITLQKMTTKEQKKYYDSSIEINRQMILNQIMETKEIKNDVKVVKDTLESLIKD